MTAEAIENMREELTIALKRFEHARNVLRVSAYSDVSSRNLSIAITQLETALLWSRRALEVRERSVKAPDIDFVSGDDPQEDIDTAVVYLAKYINPLQAEHKSGASAKWYRVAIMNVINSLQLSIMRANMQLADMD